LGDPRHTTSGKPARAVGPPTAARTIGRLVGRASWAILDQGLYSATTFATNLVLALWVAPAEYGGYMAATAIFWIALNVHDGLLIQPMMVFGSSRYHDRPTAYLAVLMVFQWCISVIVSAGLAVGGLALVFWGPRTAGFGLLGYAAAAPLVHLLWLVRRRFYVWSDPRLAAATCAIYAAGVPAIVFALHRSDLLSSFTAPLAAGGASALAIAAITGARGFGLRWSWRGDLLREAAAAHWRYGRWAVLAGVAWWAWGSPYYLVVPVLVSLEANAALNVLSNLVMPAIMLNAALVPLLVPAFSRARQDRHSASLMWLVSLVLMAGAALYSLLVGLFGGTVIDLVYRERYSQYAHLAWLIGLMVLPTAASTAFSAFLRGHERPDRELSANVWAAAVSGLCIFAIPLWGLRGAIIGLLAGSTTTMLVRLWWVLRIGIVRPLSDAQGPCGPVVAKPASRGLTSNPR
jgi:O-antigen/teichoic acid export membrane protein